MGFMKKFGWYVAVASFFLYGGCDHIMEEYLKPEYSSKVIRMRTAAKNVIEGEVSRLADSFEEKMSDLEQSVEGDKNVGEWE